MGVMPELDMVILLMDTMAKDLLTLSQRLWLMLDFSMEDMDMVLVLAMLDMAMESLLMDTMAKGLLMLMPDIFMVAMDMDLALDTVLAMGLDTVDTTMDKTLAKCSSKSSKAPLM